MELCSNITCLFLKKTIDFIIKKWANNNQFSKQKKKIHFSGLILPPCEMEDDFGPGSVGFFFQVLPPDTLNTYCVNLISKPTTICLVVFESLLGCQNWPGYFGGGHNPFIPEIPYFI